MVSIFIDSGMTMAEKLIIVFAWIALVFGVMLWLRVPVLWGMIHFNVNPNRMENTPMILKILAVIATVAVIGFVSALAYRSTR
jgi:hypothetical protein